ncbi:MAG: ABC transporter ATP-binding protein [Smithella sp.]|jgi:iron complex transport system ATP-binding protein
MLVTNDLYFRHAHGVTDVLKGISYCLAEGLMTTLLGPNGSGKTTLFKCLSGLWYPRRGTIFFGDRDLTKISCAERSGIIAVVPQEHEPPFPYTVEEVVLMGRVSHVSLFAVPSKNDFAAALEAMDKVGISHLRKRPYTKISGGERQLVLIARALAQDAPVLILDEPTSHLDFRNQILILNKVREIVHKKGLTVLMTLHDPNLAMQFSDQVIMIEAGEIVAQGTPGEVLTQENLRQMYGFDVNVVSCDGTKIIYPRVSL